MALVTIQRSPSPSSSPAESEELADEDEESSPRQRRSKSALKRLKKLFHTVRFISKLKPHFSESYFAVKGAALILPQNENESFYARKKITPSSTGEIESHLHSMFSLLRPQDTIKLAVKLECTSPEKNRYMVVVSCFGRQDTEESIILGIDCSETATIGIVFPIWADINIKLDGDGGFTITSGDRIHMFKPVSIQAMWSAIQSLNKVLKVAQENHYIPSGLTHTWIGFYNSKICWENSSEWYSHDELDSLAAVTKCSEGEDPVENAFKNKITIELRKIMMKVDLDTATSKSLRMSLEEIMSVDVNRYKSYIDTETLRIFGQMDSPSKIKDYLYLGSEWNASNSEELVENGVDHILNITREIDNFFPGVLKYMNVREYDDEEADLMKYWENTHRFIANARIRRSKVLVHCKRGISRSASTVMAYLMKEYKMSRQESFDFVHDKRSIVQPNPSFWKQLETYEGILKASNRREIFRHCKSEENLLKMDTTEESLLEGETSDMIFRDNLCPSSIHYSSSTPGNLDDGHLLQFTCDKHLEERCGIEPDIELSSRSSDSVDFLMSTSSPDESVEQNVGDFEGEDGGSGQRKATDDVSDDTGNVPQKKKRKKVRSGRKKDSDSKKRGSTEKSQVLQKKVRDDGSWIKEKDDQTNLDEINKSDVIVMQTSDDISEKDIEDGASRTEQSQAEDKNSEIESPDLECNIPEIKIDDVEICQQYVKENIPWNLGTVKKTKQDLEQKIKDSSTSLENNEDAGVLLLDGVPLKDHYNNESTENSSECLVKNIEGVTTTESCDSNVQISAKLDSDSTINVEKEKSGNYKRIRSIYELEDIPLPEGLVWRTTQEIEERNKSEEIMSDGTKKSLPLQRSSSLKSQRDTPRKKLIDRERRKTCTPILSPVHKFNEQSTNESQTISVEGSPKIKTGNALYTETEDRDQDVGTKALDADMETEQTESQPIKCDKGTSSSDEIDPDVAVYKLMGEDVPVQKGIVQKQKQDIEQMNKDRKSLESKDIQSANKPVSLPTSPSADSSDKTIVSTVSTEPFVVKDLSDMPKTDKGASECDKSIKHSADQDEMTSCSEEKNHGASEDVKERVTTDGGLVTEKVSVKPSIEEIKSNFEKAKTPCDLPKLQVDPNPCSIIDESKANEQVTKVLVSERKENFEKGVASHPGQRDIGSPVREQNKLQRFTSGHENVSSRMDSETLELIREIGSAFLNSPVKSKGEVEQCQENISQIGLVRSLARNIEQKTMKKKPAKEIIIVDKETQEKKKKVWRFSSPVSSNNENVSRQSPIESDNSSGQVIASKQSLTKSISSPVVACSSYQRQQRYSGHGTPDNSPPKYTEPSDHVDKKLWKSVDSEIDSHPDQTNVEKGKLSLNTELSEDHIDKVRNLVGRFESSESKQNSRVSGATDLPSPSKNLDSCVLSKSLSGDSGVVLQTLESKEKEKSQQSSEKQDDSCNEMSSESFSEERVELRQVRQNLRKTTICSTRPKSADVHKRKGYTQKLHDWSSGERSHSISSPSSSESEYAFEGRKVRRMQGKSHPLTKLENRRNNPFYNTM